MPSTNYRYRRWEIPVDVSEGIVDKSDDEIDDIRLIEMEKKMKRRMGDCDETSEESNELDRCSSFCTSKQPRVNEGPKSRNEEFEMKLKSLRLSRTQDTLVSYEALNVNEEDEYGSD
uniref:Protein phosphatase inhibitor 2 n=1 Tax=Rhabditophanes sp. KR3021 TaxID=114890 RepID=A0AC35TQ55_9BILA